MEVSNVNLLIISSLLITNLLLAALLLKQRFIQKEIHIIKEGLNELTTTSTSFNEHIQTKLLEEKKAHLLLLTFQLREAVSMQQFAIHSKVIEETQNTHHLSEVELSKIFSPKQVVIIEQYWSAYRIY
ncbi:hypothetical protein ACFFHM_21390 [Halalkalibacter kiskunsagensis]|uniref:Uncharacterized protein n=1 Tax=Halalkalibacter kiskunsagensis TaxID=1548599 RepID=A0ABV6KI23_9BACI